ncbi:MAG: hypothetical protein LBM99_05805 [Bacillales bacterium]|jgi:hypothetical protein|nr:hypothetical protein [Bacillales bacterium]
MKSTINKLLLGVLVLAGMTAFNMNNKTREVKAEGEEEYSVTFGNGTNNAFVATGLASHNTGCTSDVMVSSNLLFSFEYDSKADLISAYTNIRKGGDFIFIIHKSIIIKAITFNISKPNGSWDAFTTAMTSMVWHVDGSEHITFSDLITVPSTPSNADTNVEYLLDFNSKNADISSNVNGNIVDTIGTRFSLNTITVVYESAPLPSDYDNVAFKDFEDSGSHSFGSFETFGDGFVSNEAFGASSAYATKKIILDMNHTLANDTKSITISSITPFDRISLNIYHIWGSRSESPGYQLISDTMLVNGVEKVLKRSDGVESKYIYYSFDCEPVENAGDYSITLTTTSTVAINEPLGLRAVGLDNIYLGKSTEHNVSVAEITPQNSLRYFSGDTISLRTRVIFNTAVLPTQYGVVFTKKSLLGNGSDDVISKNYHLNKDREIYTALDKYFLVNYVLDTNFTYSLVLTSIPKTAFNMELVFAFYYVDASGNYVWSNDITTSTRAVIDTYLAIPELSEGERAILEGLIA